jgi:hypothetical protein
MNHLYRAADFILQDVIRALTGVSRLSHNKWMLQMQSVVIGVSTRFSSVRGARADERPFA